MNTKTSSLHIRVEPQVKEQVEVILNSLGMNTTEAVNIFLKQIIINSGIPFEIKNPAFDKDLIEALAEAEEIRKHPENYKSYTSIKELMEDLDNEQ